MRERPILFSGPMVRVLLAGSKTQTRRTVKDISALAEGVWRPFIGPDNLQTGEWFFTSELYSRVINQKRKCPYGKPGDRLWVRETWSWVGPGFSTRDLEFLRAEGPINFLYRADPIFDGMGEGDFGWDWKPSIHMPRWASRITLEVVSVKVERLQDISERDAWHEGFPDCTDGECACCINRFARLWDSINAKRPGCSWETNPWVWAIEFKRVEVPE